MDCIHHNGYITGYIVQYGVHGSLSKQIVNASDVATNTTIAGLKAATNYSIEVAAVNRVGVGMYSAAIFAVTQGIYCSKCTIFSI